ncbi:MAG: alpha/beta fold hydrolase [Candidatus Aminicenantes bacterium]|nr:alpha/beta fold hydrolase [Candidatus Aminicenantes bacterium]
MKGDTRIRSSSSHIELHVHYRIVDEEGRLPTILFSHGFTVDGTESHRMFLKVADGYNEKGFNTVLFDHRGCGYSDGSFEDFIFSSAVEDIRVVAEWVKKTLAGRSRSLVIHGQSLGTAIAAVAFHESPMVEAFVLWNLSAQIYDRYLKMLGTNILKTGKACVEQKGFFVRQAFLEDVKSYNILRFFENWNRPILFVSSGADTLGNPEFAEQAAKTVGEIGKRVVIDGAHHSFRCQPELEDQAIQESIKWVSTISSRKDAEQ